MRRLFYLEKEEIMEKEQLTLGSLFDGSGGFMLAARNAGIKPLWASELAPFPTAVTRKNFPEVRHYGDIKKLKGDKLEPVDIITGGSPCQDLSIAGKRAGLDGERSGLFHEQIRIVKEMRDATKGRYPRYMVWENVPGAFSSNKGEDFRLLLEAVAAVKGEEIPSSRPERWLNAGCILARGFSFAWRVLDSKYFRVPQRRRRIYAVADFTGSGAGEILFESQSVQGDSREGCKEGQDAAECFEQSPDKAEQYVAFENHPQDSRFRPLDGTSPTLGAYGHGGNAPLVVNAYDVRITSPNTKVSRANVYETDTSRTLNTGSNSPDSNQGGVAIVVDQGAGKSSCSISEELSPTLSCSHDGAPAVAVQGSVIGRKIENGPEGKGFKENESFTLNATDRHAVSYGLTRGTVNSSRSFDTISVSEEEAPTILSCGPGAVAESYSANKSSFFSRAEREMAGTLCATDWKDPPIVNGSDDREYIVRRLTPIECAKLQGFPDDWCDDLSIENPTDEDMEFWTELFRENAEAEGKKVRSEKEIRKWLKNPYSDSEAYKLWGNGIALPCAEFVLNGIKEYTKNNPEEFGEQ